MRVHNPPYYPSAYQLFSTFKLYSKFILPCYLLSANLHPLVYTALQWALNWVSLLFFLNLMLYPAIWMSHLQVEGRPCLSSAQSLFEVIPVTLEESHIHGLQGPSKTDSSSLTPLLVHASSITWASLLFPVHVRHASPFV